jgi:uridine kinase
MLMIGIAGGSGSGKTTFAKKIMRHTEDLDVSLLHLDSYYKPLPPADDNLDHPSVFDWELLRDHFSILKAGGQVEMPVYDYNTSKRLDQTVTVGPCRAILLEGIYALYDDAVRSLFDLKVFLSVEGDIRFIRRLHRDVRERGQTLEGVIHRYYETVRPMHHLHLEPQKQFADIIVGEETDVAAEVIAARLRTALAEGSLGLKWNNRPAESLKILEA